MQPNLLDAVRVFQAAAIIGRMDIFQFYAHNSNLINSIGINMLLGLSLYVMLNCGLLALAGVGRFDESRLIIRLHKFYSSARD